MEEKNKSEVRQYGGIICTSTSVPLSNVFQKICEDLLINGVLMIDMHHFPGQIEYGWILKGVKINGK